MKLSVIVPVLDAATHLPACLERMKGADEIVVVDGGSCDASALIAERAGARLVRSPRGRGVQLAAGARAARGEWLLFLHADTLPEPGWDRAVAAHRAMRPHDAGCFRLRLADRAWQARLIEQAVMVRTRLFGLAFGDQGLLVPRALYDEVGGYRPLPLMEDVDLVRRIGARRLALLDAAAWTSAERWRRDGWARRIIRNLFCLTLYAAGAPPARIAAVYEHR